MNEESYAIGNIARNIATDNSQDAEISQLQKELGIKNEQGSYQTSWADEERDKAKAATTEKIQKAIEAHTTNKQKPPEPPPAPEQSGTDKLLGVSPEQRAKSDAAQKKFYEDNYYAGAVMGGVHDAFQNIANAGVDAANWAEKKMGIDVVPDNFKFDFADKQFPKSDMPATKIVRGVTQFVSGFIPLGGAAKAVGMGPKIATSVAGIATDFLAFDGHDERLSNLIQSVPELANPVTEYLMAKPTDSEAEGRLKNVIEGLGLGWMAEGVFKGLKFARSKVMAEKAMKVIDDVDAGKVTHKQVVEEHAPDIMLDKDGKPPAPKVPMNEADKAAAKERVKDLREPVTLDKGGGAQLNMERIKTTDDVKTVMKNLAEKNKESIEAFRGGATTHEEIAKFAKETGMSVEELMSRRAGVPFDEVELTAARMLNAGAANKFEAALTRFEAEDSDEALVALMDSLNEFEKINLVVTGGKTKAARVFNSLNIEVHPMEARAPMIAKRLELAGGRENARTFATRLKSIPKEQLPALVRKTGTKKAFDAAFEIYVNNLLSNPKTHIINFVSNAATAAFSTTQRAFAPYMGKGKIFDVQEYKDALARQKELVKVDKSLLSIDEQLAHQSDLVRVNGIIQRGKPENLISYGVEKGEFSAALKGQASEVVNQTLSSYNAVLDGIKMLWKSAEKEGGIKKLADDALVDPFTKTEGIQPAITSQNFGGGKIVDLYGGLQRLPSKGLAWADDFWKAVNRQGEVHALAYRVARKNNLVGEEMTNFVQDFVKNPPDYAVEAANNKALINTFNNPLEEGSFGRNFQELVNTKFGTSELQPLKFVVPFTRTPINIAKYARDSTFLAMTTKKWSDAMAKGGTDAQMARSQMMLGTSIMGAATLMAGQGYLTGGGPKDYKLRKTLEDSGWKPYSVKIGDRYVPMNKFEPIGSVIAFAADMADIASAIGDEVHPADAQQLGGLVAWSVVNRFTPEMMIDNVGKLIEAIQDNDITKWTSDVASKTVPLIGMSNVLRQGMDDTSRDTKADPNDTFPALQEVLNKVKNQIPGFSDTLPPRKNIWGENIMYPSGFGSQVISPFYGSKFDGKDPVLNELVRLGYAGPLAKAESIEGETTLSIAMPRREITVKHGHADLSPLEYSRFVELSAGIGLKQTPSGKQETLKEALTRMVKTNYAAEIKEKKYLTDENKRTVIKKTVEKYRQYARSQMLDEFPKVNERIGASREAYRNAREKN